VNERNHRKQEKFFVVAKELFGDGDVRVGYLLLVNRYGFFTAVSFLQKFTLERARERHFPFGAAADGADIAMNRRTMPPGTSFAAYFA
jgi:hypothetical protein